MKGDDHERCLLVDNPITVGRATTIQHLRRSSGRAGVPVRATAAGAESDGQHDAGEVSGWRPATDLVCGVHADLTTSVVD